MFSASACGPFHELPTLVNTIPATGTKNENISVSCQQGPAGDDHAHEGLQRFGDDFCRTGSWWPFAAGWCLHIVE